MATGAGARAGSRILMATDTSAKGAARTLRLSLAGDAPEAPAPVPVSVSVCEEDLLRRAVSGDRGAWEELIGRHNHKVIVSLLARGVLLERARDIAQETWTRLIANQQAGRLRLLALPGLAIVQAGYLAASDWRRRGRELAGPPPGQASADPETQLLGREALARLQAALGDCPPSARRVFELCYQQPELGYEQVAVEVGLSTQRVKQIVCEVRKRLRLALEEIR
jgi:RNA polymerase sigma factor (sigma-70 family)